MTKCERFDAVIGIAGRRQAVEAVGGVGARDAIGIDRNGGRSSAWTLLVSKCMTRPYQDCGSSKARDHDDAGGDCRATAHGCTDSCGRPAPAPGKGSENLWRNFVLTLLWEWITRKTAAFQRQSASGHRLPVHGDLIISSRFRRREKARGVLKQHAGGWFHLPTGRRSNPWLSAILEPAQHPLPRRTGSRDSDP